MCNNWLPNLEENSVAKLFHFGKKKPGSYISMKNVFTVSYFNTMLVCGTLATACLDTEHTLLHAILVIHSYQAVSIK